MNITTLLTLALIPFSATLCTAQQPESTPPAISAPSAPSTGVQSLGDDECLAIVHYLQSTQRHIILAMADSYARDEQTDESIAALLAFLPPPESLPQDFQQYLHEFHDMAKAVANRLSAIGEQMLELRYREGADATRQRRALYHEVREMEKTFKSDLEALRARHPRAAMLGENSFFHPAISACMSYHCPDARFKSFMKEHPELRRAPKSEAMAAWMRHCADQLRPDELTPETARHTLRRMEALALLGYPEDEHRTSQESGTAGEDTENLILPSARAQGYTWKLETPLGESPLVELEWHYTPTAELKKLQQLGLIPSYRDLPNAGETCIIALHFKKAGKTNLRFVCTHPDIPEPLMTRTVELDIEAPEDEE